MARIAPLSRQELADFEPLLEAVEKSMGFVPNSLLTMAHRPEILRAFTALAGSVLGPGRLSRELKQLVAFVSSNASGCRYCQAHTSHAALSAGAAKDKIEAAFDYATSPLFSDAERSALALAQAAGLVPNQATDKHFAALREHYDEEEIVELVAVISLFGWLNRWNDTLATTLEEKPVSFAADVLATHGWRIGKHC